MKVRASVKPICEKCKIIRRNGNVMVICRGLHDGRHVRAEVGQWEEERGLVLHVLGEGLGGKPHLLEDLHGLLC